VYGQDKPPVYNLSNISNFKIDLVCGKTDLLVVPKDYTKLKDEMVSYNNDVGFFEYECGHLGLILPVDPAVNDTMLERIMLVTDSAELIAEDAT